MNITASEARALAESNPRVEHWLKFFEWDIMNESEKGKFEIGYYLDDMDTKETRDAIIKVLNEQGFKTKLPFTGDLDSFISEIKTKFAGSRIIAEDGIKIITDKSWVQLRKSNTEPIIRIIAEAESIEEVNQLIKTITDIVNV